MLALDHDRTVNLAAVLKVAESLAPEPDGTSEYLRGQAELIRDLFATGHRDSDDALGVVYALLGWDYPPTRLVVGLTREE